MDTGQIAHITPQTTEIVADELGLNERDIASDSRFVEDLGADSLDVLELTMRFEEEFEIDISDEEVEKIATVGDAIRLIEEKVRATE